MKRLVLGLFGVWNLFFSDSTVLAWKTSIDRQGVDQALKITADAAGNVVAVGRISSELAVVKYNGANGNVLWLKLLPEGEARSVP